jgi:hypothetical protein
MGEGNRCVSRHLKESVGPVTGVVFNTVGMYEIDNRCALVTNHNKVLDW